MPGNAAVQKLRGQSSLLRKDAKPDSGAGQQQEFRGIGDVGKLPLPLDGL